MQIPSPAGRFRAALRAAPLPAIGIRILAELKGRSPSSGTIREDYRPAELARVLSRGGASALSVLTEPDFFGGSGEHLAAARAAAGGVPVLRKDFLLDPWQVWESRLLGADAVLLIAEVLGAAGLGRLMEETRATGLEPLVECRDESEIDLAAGAGAMVIGVNARDLADFSIDLARVERLRRAIPEGVIAVAESGVRGREDLARLARCGFDAALVGTTLMKAPDPGALLASWVGAGDVGSA
jgi:indole-3-glycerol phosphate synthase